MLVAARAAQGLGAARHDGPHLAFVGDTVPKARTGSAMGLLGTTSAIGTALGPSLGGVLIAALGWRAIFLVNVPLGIARPRARAPPSARRPPDDRAARARFDVAGTLLLALTLAAYALAMTSGAAVSDRWARRCSRARPSGVGAVRDRRGAGGVAARPAGMLRDRA